MATLSRFRCTRETLGDLILEFCLQELILRPVSRLWDTISELADVRLSAGKKTKFLNRGQEHEWWWKFSLEGSEQKETRSDLFSCTCKMLDVPLNLYHPRCHSALHTPQPGEGGVSPELCFVEREPRTCKLCVMHREQIAKSPRHNFGLLHRAGKAKCDFSHH